MIFYMDLDNAMKNVEQAVAYENEGEYEQALEKYQAGLEYFMKAMEAEKNSQIKQAIRDKVAEYMARAEFIKDFVNKSKKNSQKMEVSPAASPYEN